jgi:signal peptidase I
LRSPKKRSKRIVAILLSMMFLIVLALSATYVLVFDRALFPTRSMEPTIKSGDFIFINNYSYRIGSPARGDIVAFDSSDSGAGRLVKRVVGLPGETVKIEKGQVFIDERPLQEDYVQDTDKQDFSSLKIPSDSYFLMGDNRPNSADSRTLGPVQEGNINGKVWFR